MHPKQIKALIRKQLNKEYPNWKRLSKKQKKTLAKQVLAAVVEDYDFTQEISTSPAELVGIDEQIPTEDIMTLDEMAAFVAEFRANPPISLAQHPRHASYLYERELRLIDDLLDNRILNELLSYDGYTPSMRKFLPST